ncbi:hypothetical protein BGZ80_007355, partial [Entomortierella chlamydospora]
WALEQKDKEHVYLTNFVARFDLTNRESATEMFEHLIQSSNLPNKRRGFIASEYHKFQLHHADKFWAKHSLALAKQYLKLNSERTSKELACAAQDTAIYDAKTAY